jgi:predicted pyridoxine 5'-phosphate oxidase superfamily flavin-nucleotide-binding protein
MAGKFIETFLTPEVLAAQAHYFGASRPVPPQGERDLLTEREFDFIAARDSFYIATVTSSGWPYIQHRGGAAGFLKVTAPSTLAFADFRGNRQLLSTGNLAGNDRVVLFLMDYPGRSRLKIMGHARVLDARENPALADQLSTPESRNLVERIFQVDVVSFDWNCSQHITPRYTESEIRELIGPLQERIARLESQILAASPPPNL